jgi:hypothetical protein
MTLSPLALRAALEEYIRAGPEARRPVEERLGARLPELSPAELAAALAGARTAVAASERLAKECMDGYRSERSVAAALREQFPWLGKRRLFDAGLARRLAEFGFYLMK